MNPSTLTESEARHLANCPCCGKPKGGGLVVCWTCFKHETPSGFEPLKYAALSFEEWLPKAKGGEL